jgi:cephalosporin hydroxylase
VRLTIDTASKTMSVEEDGRRLNLDLFSKESFDRIAELWVGIGWVRKYSYGFSWMGRPIIQLPDDMVRIQEAIFATRPDTIIETGVAHGGSLIYYASLFEALGHGRVIGIDVEIRPANRAAIEAHPMFRRISLVEGNSIAQTTVDRVKALLKPGETVMVILDSNHSKAHVAGELDAYADMVTNGHFLLVQDGVMQQVAGMPRTQGDWSWNNPISAVSEFLAKRPDFERAPLPRPFDESQSTPECTHHAQGWLRRRA